MQTKRLAVSRAGGCGVRGSPRLAVAVAITIVTLGWLAATGLAARMYVAVGDSITVGVGATPGHSFFDLYCAYLKSPAGGARVDRCINDAVGGLSSQAALGATMQTVVNTIKASTDTPVVTVDLGGIDLLSSPGCQPITGARCTFIHNMRAILNELESALATHPGPHVIQWLEYYNINHDNPFGTPAGDRNSAARLLGNDFALTSCTSGNLSLIGLNDVVNCIAREKGVTPVDAYTAFQNNCAAGNCFSDSVHPSDTGYQLIFDALRETPGSPCPGTTPPDGSWPLPTRISALRETRTTFAPAGANHKGGTIFTFSLGQPAGVEISIVRRTSDRHARPIATLTTRGRPGLNKIAFAGRVHRGPLAPGHYLAIFKTTGAVIVSTTRTLEFTVVM